MSEQVPFSPAHRDLGEELASKEQIREIASGVLLLRESNFEYVPKTDPTQTLGPIGRWYRYYLDGIGVQARIPDVKKGFPLDFQLRVRDPAGPEIVMPDGLPDVTLKSTRRFHFANLAILGGKPEYNVTVFPPLQDFYDAADEPIIDLPIFEKPELPSWHPSWRQPVLLSRREVKTLAKMEASNKKDCQLTVYEYQYLAKLLRPILTPDGQAPNP